MVETMDMFGLNTTRRLLAGPACVVAIFAALTLLAFAMPAQAQHGLGDGRALDRNLQSGSGGVNQPRRGNTYGQYSDAIITGNVGGLGAFRGGIDYRAPGEFTGGTSLDDTYNFRRIALPQSVQRRPGEEARGSTINPQIDPLRVQGTVMLRGGTGTRVSDINRRIQQFPDSFVIEDRGDRHDRGLLDDDPLRGNFEDRIIPDRRAAGLLADDRGRLLQLTTSPLTGLRREVVGRMRVPTMGDEDQEADEDLTPDERREREREALEEARRRGRLVDERITGRLGDDRDEDSRPARVGERDRVEGRIDPADSPLAQLTGDDAPERGEDVYADLLRDIDRQTSGRLQLGTRRRDFDKGRQQSRIEQLAEQFESAQRGEGLEGDDEQDPMDRLASGLSYDLPPVESFVGTGDSRVNRLLAQAERYMDEGQYFQAEAMYDRVLVLQPDYAIAEMGRVHAQIGAGLYLSAASNLRFALATNPQLIAARYGDAVMPDASRLDVVREELRDLAESDPDAASLLQSYLAYQEGRSSDLAASLDELERYSSEQDPVVDILRRVWLDRQPQSGDAPADSPLDSPDQPTDDAPGDATEGEPSDSSPPPAATDPTK